MLTPNYGVGEVAVWLALPRSTVAAWALGQGADFRPVIDIADREARLLSFQNLVELHVLKAIRRKYGVTLQNVRKAVQFLQQKLGQDHPLASERMLTDGRDLLVRHGTQLLNASRSGQAEMDVIEPFLQRLEFEDERAVRLFPFTRKDVLHAPRSIVIDPRVQFGRPCLSDTGIPTSLVMERFLAGEAFGEIAFDYGVAVSDIEEAIRYERLPAAA